jgi:hypothetical protein
MEIHVKCQEKYFSNKYFKKRENYSINKTIQTLKTDVIINLDQFEPTIPYVNLILITKPPTHNNFTGWTNV